MLDLLTAILYTFAYRGNILPASVFFCIVGLFVDCIAAR